MVHFDLLAFEDGMNDVPGGGNTAVFWGSVHLTGPETHVLRRER